MGTKVYFAGGTGPGNVKSLFIDVLETSNGTWSLEQLSQARSDLAVAVVGTKIIFAGGQSASGRSDVIDIFDTSTGLWIPTTQKLSRRRSHLSATTAGTKVFFAGGYETGNDGTDEVDIYDDITGEWAVATLTKKRFALAATTVVSKAMFAGGGGPNDVSQNVVDIFDAGAPVVTLLSPLDDAAGLGVSTNLVITFNENVQVGSGNITVKENGVTKTTINILDHEDQISISGNTVTINLDDDFTNGATVSIEIDAGVFRDQYKNNYLGITNATTWNFETIVSITGQNFSPTSPVLEKGGQTAVTITLSDANDASNVAVFSKNITKKNATFQPITGVTQSGNNFSKIFTSDELSDPLGVVYYFEVTDKASQIKLRSDTGTSQIFYPSAFTKEIPFLQAGDAQNSYQLISVPLDLTDPSVLAVFKELDGYNEKLWRLFEFEEGDNREFKKPGAFTKILPGKGYWFIMRNETGINPGTGTTVKVTEKSPHKIKIKPGFNLIGNPYNFNLDWDDVLDENDDPPIDELMVFDHGTNLEPSDRLDSYKGAFLWSDSPSEFDLKIPVTANPEINNRKARIPREVDLSNLNWQLPLTLTDGILTNKLGGIGMNVNATQKGKDRFDAVCAPMLDGIGMFEMAFLHPEFGWDFNREVVPSADNFEWEFMIRRTSDKSLKINWNNDLILDTEKELYLFDPSVQIFTDMKTLGTYNIMPSARTMKVFYGSKEYIDQKMDELLPLFGAPYPNPAEDEIKVPVWITKGAGAVDVRIKVYNMMGTEITTLKEGVFNEGIHEVIWDTRERTGLYLICMQAANQEKKWAKVLVK